MTCIIWSTKVLTPLRSAEHQSEFMAKTKRISMSILRKFVLSAITIPTFVTAFLRNKRENYNITHTHTWLRNNSSWKVFPATMPYCHTLLYLKSKILLCVFTWQSHFFHSNLNYYFLCSPMD